MTLKMSIQHYLVWLSMHELECHLQSQACSVSDSLQEPWRDSGWSRICSLPWGDSLQNLLLSKSTYSLLPKLGAVPVPCSWMVNLNCILKRLRRKKKQQSVKQNVQCSKLPVTWQASNLSSRNSLCSLTADGPQQFCHQISGRESPSAVSKQWLQTCPA